MTWNIGGELGSGYTPPLSPSIGGDVFPPSGTLLPVGLESTAWGESSIFNRLQHVEPIGVFDIAFGATSVAQNQQLIVFGIAGAYGSPLIENYTRHLLPTGFVSSSFGLAELQNTSLGIFASGWDSLTIGPAESPHRISYYLAIVSTSGIDDLDFGDSLVADAIRLLRPTSIAGSFGGPTVTNYTRTLEAIGFRTDEIGAHEVGTTQTISAFGFEPLSFGTTLAKDDRQFSAVAGITGQFGLSVVRRMLEFIRADAATQGTAFGPAQLFNRTQIITTRWPEGHVAGPVSAPFVELQDRPMFPFGFDALRFPVLGPSVRLGPPPIEVGLGRTSEWGFALVAPRIRSVTTFGRSMEEFSSPIVQNAAASFTPVPFDAAQYGSPGVLNLWQFFAGFGVGSTLGMGVPFVAPRVRTLIATGMFTFEAGRSHSLGRSPQFAQPQGIVGSIVAPFVANRPVLRAEVRNDNPGVFGRPSAINRNRVVRPFGFSTDAYGNQSFQNYRRSIAPVGFDELIAGQHQIGDRLRHVRPLSINGSVGFHRARLFPEPIQNLYVYAGSITSGSVEIPSVGYNSAFPQGMSTLSFGQAVVTSNVIRPRAWVSLEMEETRPGVISYQTIFLGETEEWPGLESFGISSMAFGSVSMSPYTVWAPEGAPQQAKDNHPPGLEEPIGVRTGTSTVAGGVVPSPFVSNYTRQCDASGISQLLIGNASISRLMEVVSPSSFRGRFGFPFVIGGNLSCVTRGSSTDELGRPIVSIVDSGAKTASALGFSGSFGLAFISRDPEEVLPFGFDSFSSGGVGGTWVSLEYDPFPVAGFDATEWGIASVSPVPQVIYAFGWSSFASGPDEISLRMRVFGRSVVTTLGSATDAFGGALVERGQRAIQAFSVFKQGVPAPRVQSRLGAEGVDGLAVPSPVVDQVEESVLKAKGWISDAFGIPGLTLSMTVSGFGGSIGTPSVYHRLAPTGIVGTFGSTLITGDAGHTCGMMARGVLHVWTEVEEFGVAEVDHG